MDTRRLPHLGLLVAGCCTGCAELSPPAAPLAFEQFCEQAASVGHASDLAAWRGLAGWELVGSAGGMLCYKRAIRDVRTHARAVAELGQRAAAHIDRREAARVGDGGDPRNPATGVAYRPAPRALHIDLVTDAEPQPRIRIVE